ncbi:sensor histidine kinase [Paenibacillus pasadenensis]|uniref:sensor histidine kinase n=1 Tax=Paenibacillus pasadenensis TaxID=217090 RepID=UPI00203DD453|nr:sensor histidine kinase [Paenibacillus pasadenensis]MCM3748195.1 sensor histidine kinase [Paenibacillus pasadenensis]
MSAGSGQAPGQSRFRLNAEALLLYVRGRLGTIGILAASLAAGSAIWYLERTGTGQTMDWSNLLYFWLLSSCIAMSGLAVGFMRNKTYLVALLRRTDTPTPLWMPLPEAVTPEQKRTALLVDVLSRSIQEQLTAFNRERELHRHFVYQWVHHMKTPVSVIDLIAQNNGKRTALQEGELQEIMGSLREEADRLTRGLEQMLHTARLEEFALDLHPRRIALHEAARQAINQHKRLLIAAGVFPQIEGEAWAETDGKWLNFLLSQLIGNAIKYSKPKAGAKRLIIEISSSKDGKASIAVADEGIGIPVQDLPRVFDPFFTGENGRRTEESTGMGLYLCRQVAGKLGVSLELHSQEGEGTTAKLWFETTGLHKLQH